MTYSVIDMVGLTTVSVLGAALIGAALGCAAGIWIGRTYRNIILKIDTKSDHE